MAVVVKETVEGAKICYTRNMLSSWNVGSRMFASMNIHGGRGREDLQRVETNGGGERVG